MDFHKDYTAALSATEDSEEDDPPSSVDNNDDDDETLTPGVHMLGLSKSYVPEWIEEDAFRELFQNWKDAIINSFHLDPGSFTTVIKDTESHIEVMAYADQKTVNQGTDQELLGYIRFNKKAGTVELTNFKAALGLKHLALGVSEKRNQDKLAGTHGEGFKLAALVLSREGRGVRITSSCFYWNFSFRGRNRTTLGCRLSQIKDTKLRSLKKKYNAQKSRRNFERGLTSNIWEDVTVTISKARGDFSYPVRETEFQSWMKITLDLNPPASGEIVHTQYGDLILDPSYAGSIYLKGLQIAGHERTYIYGYNFARGDINRDRDRLADLNEEKRTLSRIWGDAILQDDSKIAALYIDLLLKHKRCAETLWTGEGIAKPSVKIVWRCLRESNPSAFFYFEDDSLSGSLANDQEEIIRTDLDKVPFLLSRELWELLRKHDLARSPGEEQAHRFGESFRINPDQDSFHTSIIQTLQASLSLDSNTNSLEICFVEGGGTRLDIMFDADTKSIKVHQRWLDFDKIHEDATCEFYDLVKEGKADEETPFCDHVVEDLLERIFEKIGSTLEIPLSRQRAIRGKARSCLRSMPRSVQVSQVQSLNALEVTWIANENGFVSEKHSENVRYIVILHKEDTCKPKRDYLVWVAAVHVDSTIYGTADLGTLFSAQCGCPAQFVSRTSSKARFNGLSVRNRYFPMVARAGKISFFGCPPPSIALKSTLARTPCSSRTIATSSPRIQCSPLPSKGKARAEQYSSTSAIKSTQSIDLSSTHEPEETGSAVEDVRFSDHDQREWQNWLQKDLLRNFVRFQARRGIHNTNSAQSVGSLECPHLDFEFEKDEYACVRLSSSGSAEFPVFVYGIFAEDENFDQDTTCMLVTRYSLLKTVLPSHTQPIASNDSREVILHFREYDKMGTREDAEIIKLNEIIGAERLTAGTAGTVTEIDHLVQPPQDLANASMFCRFAVGTAQRESEACLTPIASHLLLRQNRWKEVKFPTGFEPVVYDFSPGVLGPSEGLSQAGFAIEVGLGFDPSNNLSWKARHHGSQVYDGSAKSVLESFDRLQLRAPASSQLPIPKVAVVAGSNVPFRLNDQNEHLPSLDYFLEVLDKVESAAQSSLQPTFTVMLISPALLHPKAMYRLNATILRLLDQRLSVHMKLCSLRGHGLPFQRDVLALVTSSFCSPVPWNLYWPMLAQPQAATIGILIRDLSFENPRITDEPNSGFVCLRPDDETFDSQDATYIHNHHTGQQTSSSQAHLQWETDKLDALTTTPKPWGHPTRNDRLTVREIARLQGFPDDFVFYHSEETQYKDVWAAFPPVITKLVGQMIRYMLQRSQAIKMGDQVEGSKGKKRARVDSEV